MSAPEPYPPYDDLSPRFRWVPPLMIGLTFGAVAGMLVTFAVQRVTTKPGVELLAPHIDIRRVVTAAAPQGELGVSTDTTLQIGRRNVSTNTADAVRRRVLLQGSVTPDRADALRRALDAALQAEIGRQGGSQSGSGSSTSSGLTHYRAIEEVSYYTRDGRQGHIDIVFDVQGNTANVVIILTEAR